MSAAVPRHEQSATTDPPPRRAATEHAVPLHDRDDVIVIEPVGQLDRTGVDRLHRAALSFTEKGVVIDLRDCVLTDPNALVVLADGGADPADLCFVSRRPTCRLLLARAGITSRFAVFGQVEDALQARAFARSGYGRGWRRCS